MYDEYDRKTLWEESTSRKHAWRGVGILKWMLTKQGVRLCSRCKWLNGEIL
jgi:hypothetical protein